MRPSPPAPPLRILLVDDSLPVRSRIRSLIEEALPVEIVGETNSVAGALALVKTRQPDAVVLDLNLSDGDGRTVLAEIKRAQPACIVLVLTSFADEITRESCLIAGADFFFNKTREFERVPEVLAQLRRRAVPPARPPVKPPGQTSAGGEKFRPGTGGARAKFLPLAMLAIFLLLAAGIVLVGFRYRQSLIANFRHEVRSQLAVIAELRADRLADWRTEHFNDARFFHDDRALALLVRDCLAQPADAASPRRQELRVKLATMDAHPDYDAFLLDAGGRIVLAPTETPVALSPAIQAGIARARRTGQITWVDFYRTESPGKVWLALLIPLAKPDGGGTSPGFILWVFDAGAVIYPRLNHWPVLSASAEFLLLRREGDEAVVLNPLRSKPDAALNLRLALSRETLPPAGMALGQADAGLETNPRGQPMLAAIRPVPGSPWFVVARMAEAEANAQLDARLRETMALISTLLLGAVVGVGLWWRHRRTDYHREKFLVAQALHGSEARYQSVVDSANDAIVTFDTAGRITGWNRGAERMFQYEASDIMDRPAELVLAPAEHADFQGVLARFQTGEPVLPAGQVVEAGGRRKDGTVFPMEISSGIWQISNERFYTATIRDITARKAAEQQIRAQADLLNQTHDAILVTDPDHRFTFLNQSAERILGWTAAEALGQTAETVFGHNVEARLGQIRSAVASTGNWQGELAFSRRDGRSVILDLRVSLVRDAAGQPAGRLTLGTDITEKKQLEEQFHRVQRLENLGMLATGIAHDMNNILVPIVMAVPLLKSQIHQEPGLGLLATMEKSGLRGAALVRQLLTFAHGSGDAPKLLQLRHVLTDLAEMIRATFPKSIQLESHLPGNLWPLTGSVTQLHQIFLNLCINARDAMPDGGMLNFRAANTQLTPSEARSIPDARPGNFVVVTVADTGTGIAPEILARMWDPFFTTKAPDKGTGLGLSTARALIAGHGGFVHVKSVVDQGTTFAVYLPAAETPVRDVEPDATLAPFPRGAGELILVVDDELSVCDVVRRGLEAQGYRVLTAQGGQEAISRFNTRAIEVRLLLTDLFMPQLDGRNLINLLHQIRPGLPVVVMSGADNRTLVKNMPFVSAVISKPFSMAELLGAVQAALQTPPVRGAPAQT